MSSLQPAVIKSISRLPGDAHIIKPELAALPSRISASDDMHLGVARGAYSLLHSHAACCNVNEGLMCSLYQCLHAAQSMDCQQTVCTLSFGTGSWSKEHCRPHLHCIMYRGALVRSRLQSPLHEEWFIIVLQLATCK